MNRNENGNKTAAQEIMSDLRAEEKKIKRLEILAAVVIGFLVGVMIYGLATKGFGIIYIAIPLIIILRTIRNSQKLKTRLQQIRLDMVNQAEA
ncbi:MAG: hypothetical protein AAFV80_13880 [Bacteroidota bacterium]